MVARSLLASLAFSAVVFASKLPDLSAPNDTFIPTSVKPKACHPKTTVTATLTVEEDDGVTTLKTYEPYTRSAYGMLTWSSV